MDCKKGLRLISGISLLVMLLGCSSRPVSPSPSDETDNRPYIAIISKGYQHDYWRSVELGARTAGDELGVQITFEGPDNETMIDKQIEMVKTAIAKKADAILLAALDTQALIPVVEEAHNQNIPVIMFDSNINSSIPISFVGTDNYLAGRVAAQHLAEAVGNKGRVVIVAHNQVTSTATERRNGFVQEIETNFPYIQVVETRYSEGDQQKARRDTLELMDAIPDLAGIFATNEGSAIGAARAIEERGTAGQTVLVGFDLSDTEIGLLQEGVLTGLMVQNPFKIGYLGVKTALDVLNDKTVDNRIDTGATFVDLNNLNNEDIQKLLYPLGKE